MAYNPFNWFRKYQKTLFAVLTIIIMFVFIAQFGAGDIMHYANFWFSTGRSTGPEVTPLGNRTVHAGDVEQVTGQRELANRFLLQLIQTEKQPATDKLLNKLQKLEDSSPLLGLRDILDGMLMSRREMENMQRQMQQLAMMGRMDQQLMESFQRSMMMQRNRVLENLLRLLRDPNTGLPSVVAREKVKDNRDHLELVMQTGSILGIETWLLATATPDAFVMGGTRDPESTLDFLLWQQQADRLGITITDEDLAKQINRDFGGLEIFEPGSSLAKNKRVVQFVGGGRDREVVKPSALIEALREEYRVAMAQSLLLGFEPGIRVWRSVISGGANPTTGTPDEFLQFVRNYRTTLRVQAMPVSLDSFISKVDQQPTEAELERLFGRFRDQEPDPTRRTPGFKLPRRVRVQYVIGGIDTPAFRDAGQTWANYLFELHDPFRRAKSIVLSPLLSPLGAGPFGPALAMLGPIVNDPVQREYQEYLGSADAWIFGDDLLSSGREKRLQLTSVTQPVALASMITVSGGPVPMLASLYANGTMNEVRGSLRFTAARILGSAPAQPGWTPALTAVALSAPYRATPLSEETLRPVILSNLQQRLSRERVHLAIDQLREELREKKEKVDVVARAKALNLEFHEMPQAVSQLALIDADKTPGAEKGLTAFRDFFRRGGQTEVGFGQLSGRLFQSQGTFKLEPVSRANFRAPETILEQTEKEELLAWRVEDLGARLRTFEEARADVLQAWRVEKARDKARARALEIRNLINKEKLSPADALRLLKENRTGDLFVLEDVARMLPPKEVRPEALTEYRFYQVPTSLQQVLPYPPAELAKQLMELKRPGEAMVFVDVPARTFYVAVLEARDEPSLADFRKLYDRTPFRDPLFDRFQDERRAEYRKNVMLQLRREAGAKLDREGNYELPEFLKRGQNTDEMPR